MSRTPDLATPLMAEHELSLEALYQQHHAFVWRNARRLGVSDAWVDDAVHEVFLIAASKLSEFEGRANPRTWLFSITYRVILRMQRDRARYAKRLAHYAREPNAATTDSAPAEARYDLVSLLQQLDADKRLVFILVELEGFTTAEISRTLGLRPGTVSTRLRAARIELERALRRQSARERSDSR